MRQTKENHKNSKQKQQQRRRLSLTYIRYAKDNNKTIAQAAQQQQEPQPATKIKHKPKRVCLPNLLLDQLTFPTATNGNKSNTKQQQQQPTNGHECVRAVCVHTCTCTPRCASCVPVYLCVCTCVSECVSVLLLMTT